MEYKIIVSIVGIVLSLIGYGIYISGILKRKIIPHAFTFLIWSISSSITWALQVYGGAGVGAWVTFTVSLILIFIFLLSLKFGEKDIRKIDIIFLLLSFLSLFLWIAIDQPVLSIILIVFTDVLGFFPTIRKSFYNPNQESVVTWGVAIFRHSLVVTSLVQINILTILSPLVWAITNTLFIIFLIIRRRQLNKIKEKTFTLITT